MKRKALILTAAAALILGVFVGSAVGDHIPLPGSEEDPLVTKSYVDSALEENFQSLSQSVTELEGEVRELKQTVESLEGKVEPKETRLYVDSIEAYIGDEAHTLDAAPFIENQRTYVPFRFVGEALGAHVDWIEEERKVTYELRGTEIELTLGSRTIVVNGEAQEMEVPPKLENGRTMVPVRVVSNKLGADVQWVEEERLVIIKP